MAATPATASAPSRCLSGAKPRCAALRSPSSLAVAAPPEGLRPRGSRALSVRAKVASGVQGASVVDDGVERPWKLSDARLVLEDGSAWKAKSFGASGTQVGEVVFNTSLTGYQEILTDPSYAGQFVLMTNPHIGNTGVNPDDEESSRCFLGGLIIRNLSICTSNWRCKETLEEYLIKRNIMGIYDVDTRAITRRLREDGSLIGVLSTDQSRTDDELLEMAQKWKIVGVDLISGVTCDAPYEWSDKTDSEWEFKKDQSSETFHVVAYDFGIKHNIMRRLTSYGCKAIFILVFFSSPCQSNNQLTQAKPLFLKDKLVSEGGDFALGFFSPTNSSRKLYIGIWYNSIPERTVVWVANRDNPINSPSSAKLAITNNSELVLSDSQGQSIWKTNNTRGGAGAFAVILNSGNFVLRLPNGRDIWQSFDHPTDTILPTMRFILRYKAPPAATRFFAWKGPDDPSTGDISCGTDPTLNLQMFIWNRTLPYIRFSIVNGVSVSGGTYQINGSSIIMYEEMISTRDEQYYKYTVSPGSPYMRFSLDYTGKLRLLSWSSAASSWAVIFERPTADCDLYASCGPFGFCDLTEAIPTCHCPDGFEVVNQLNFSRGCRRKEAIKCGKESYFTTMPYMKVPDKFLHIRNRSFDQCASECTRNCSCVAYAYANLSNAGTTGDTSRCLVWTGDLIDMEKASFAENLYIRLGESPVQKKSNLLKILLPVIACLMLFALVALVWICKSIGKLQKKKVQRRTMLEYMSSTDEAGDKNIEFPFISFENIVTATDNFSAHNMLGQGGFGKVYKGMLEGTKEVAVKRLSKGSGQGTEEFRNEVVLISKLQHKNLVKLLGCCILEDEKLLVYEYLPNKSLDYFLFDSARKAMLQWPTRFKIIQEVARGIMYLHQDSRLTIIHRDLKASNILLDKEMSPKISDFGMARIFCGNQHHANTNRVVGTYGYMSPEYAMEGIFSVKSDTYSFGVLLLEIVSGLKISSPHLVMDFPNLIVYAWNLWKDGKTEDLVDPSVKENCSFDEVSRCIHIGLLCAQDNPNCRPLMSTVVLMLESKTTPLPTPLHPVYFASRDAEPGRSSYNRVLSLNDMSVTVLEGR